MKRDVVQVIWELRGDSLLIFMLDCEQHKEQIEWAKASHNIFINGDDISDDHPIHKLQDWLFSPEGQISKIFYSGHKDAVVDCSIWNIEAIVYCGFLM